MMVLIHNRFKTSLAQRPAQLGAHAKELPFYRASCETQPTTGAFSLVARSRSRAQVRRSPSGDGRADTAAAAPDPPPHSSRAPERESAATIVGRAPE